MLPTTPQDVEALRLDKQGNVIRLVSIYGDSKDLEDVFSYDLLLNLTRSPKDTIGDASDAGPQDEDGAAPRGLAQALAKVSTMLNVQALKVQASSFGKKQTNAHGDKRKTSGLVKPQSSLSAQKPKGPQPEPEEVKEAMDFHSANERLVKCMPPQCSGTLGWF